MTSLSIVERTTVLFTLLLHGICTVLIMLNKIKLNSIQIGLGVEWSRRESVSVG